MYKLLPPTLPNIDVTTFSNGSSTKVLPSVRNRRVFGIVNTGTTNLEVRLQPDGAGDPILVRMASTSGAADGGSLDFAGYCGEVWIKGSGYVYHYSE